MILDKCIMQNKEYLIRTTKNLHVIEVSEVLYINLTIIINCKTEKSSVIFNT